MEVVLNLPVATGRYAGLVMPGSLLDCSTAQSLPIGPELHELKTLVERNTQSTCVDYAEGEANGLIWEKGANGVT